MNENHEEENRDELLLESLMDVVPSPEHMAELIRMFEDGTPFEQAFVPLLKGYGLLLNIVQAASENEGSITDRLYAGYYELTNSGPTEFEG